MGKVSNHKGKSNVAGKLHVEKKWVFIETYKQIAVSSCNKYSEVNSLLSATSGKSTETHSKNNFLF